nr:MAG TPA: replication protein P [Caudoviricetes sp.]
MQEINFESTLKSLAPLVYAYQKEVKEGTFEAYATYLADVPPEYIRRAVDNLIRSSKWLPTVAEIREQAQAEWAEEKGLEEETAEKAWIALLQMIRKHGFVEPKREAFTSAAYQAMRAVGWTAICMAKNNELSFLHNQYVSAYNEFKGDKPVLIKKLEAIDHAEMRLLGN